MDIPEENNSTLQLKTTKLQPKNIIIRDIPCTYNSIQCTIVSKNTIYYISYEDMKKLFKYDLETGKTNEYQHEGLTKCTNINYNSALDRVYITVYGKGVFNFQPGREDEISRLSSFPQNLTGYMKLGMAFNGVQGIVKNWDQLYYCSNLLEDKESVKLDIQTSQISEVVFLNHKYLLVLYHEDKKMVVVDLEKNQQMEEQQVLIPGGGYASSMSIDKDTLRLVVGVRDGKAWDSSSSNGSIYQYRVVFQLDGVPKLKVIGERYGLGDSNTGIYDLKMTRLKNKGDQLIILASIHTYEKGKKQIRIFEIDEENDDTINEVTGIDELESSRSLLDIEFYEDSCVVGCLYDGSENLVYVKFGEDIADIGEEGSDFVRDE